MLRGIAALRIEDSLLRRWRARRRDEMRPSGSVACWGREWRRSARAGRGRGRWGARGKVVGVGWEGVGRGRRSARSYKTVQQTYMKAPQTVLKLSLNRESRVVDPWCCEGAVASAVRGRLLDLAEEIGVVGDERKTEIRSLESLKR